MASIVIRFNANQLKRDLADVLDKKVRAVTKDPNLYLELLRTFDYVSDKYKPFDTGALTYASTRYKGSAKRVGKTTFSSKGIRYSADETRLNGETTSYVGYAHNFSPWDRLTMENSATRYEFLERADKLITDYFRRA